MDDFAYADRISDRLIDMINAERTKPGFTPTQMLAGLMLATTGFLRTAPEQSMPQEVKAVRAAMAACLLSMKAAAEKSVDKS